VLAVILALPRLAWIALLLAARHVELRVEAHLAARWPDDAARAALVGQVTPPNATALEVERIAARMGILFPPDGSPRRATPSRSIPTGIGWPETSCNACCWR